MKTNLVLEAELPEETTALRALALFNYTKDALPYRAWLLAGVNLVPDASLAVVADNWASLVVVGTQALLECVGIVIAALDERLASYIVSHVLLGRVEDLVVRATGCGVDETTSNSCNEQTIIDLKFDGVLERLPSRDKHLVELLGLWNSAGEAIKNETARVSLAHCHFI